MTLRPDQLQAKADVGRAFAQGASDVLFVAPTGWGKTHFSADLSANAVAKGRTVGFFTDREEIALDTTARKRAQGLRVGLVMADEAPDPEAPVQVVSVATCRARGLVPRVDFAIWDEAHHLGSSSWLSLFEQVKAQGARSLGITATAQRGDGRPLSMFQALVTGPSVRWCMDQGFLVEAEMIAPPFVEERGLTTSPLDAYLRWAAGSRAIVFCANVAHARQTAEEWTAAGVPNACITGTTSRKVRRGIREQMESGALAALISVGCFVEGFDMPCTETVILARSFGVTGSFLQSIGRGLRRYPGKTKCTVIDLRGSVHLHGLPDESRTWSLSGGKIVRDVSLTALRRCADCAAIFRPAAACPRCGAEMTASAKVPRVLKRAERLERMTHLPQAERDRRYLERLEQIALTRMRKSEWAAKQWAERQFEKTRGRKPEMAA